MELACAAIDVAAQNHTQPVTKVLLVPWFYALRRMFWLILDALYKPPLLLELPLFVIMPVDHAHNPELY